MPSTTRRRVPAGKAAMCVLAIAATTLVIPPDPASRAPGLVPAATTTQVSGAVVTVAGHGYGHGRGMSQYGARGAALSGRSVGEILDFYYPGTATATLPHQNIRVLVSGDEGSDVLVLPSHNLAVYDAATSTRELLPPGPTHWRIVALSTGRLQVQARVSGQWSGFEVGGQSTLAGPVHFTGTEFVKLVLPGGAVRGYRAEMIARPNGAGRLQTVNLLPFEDYLRGVVPRESPSSWPAAALQAQAVAARSYSENKRARSTAAGYDICDTIACQVYSGARTYDSAGNQTGVLEAASTDAAIAATSRQVRTYAGAVILAEFSSSNGGWTASGSTPYFVSKADPYEAAGNNPYADWTASIPVGTLQAAFPAVGRLTAVTVVDRYGGGEWGGRVSTVVLRGVDPAGRATAVETTGARIRTVAGLRSTYFTFTGPAGGNPRGTVDHVGPDRSYTGEVTIRGWSIDDDAPTTPTQVHVYVNGRGAASVRADQSRPDVGSAFPDAGDLHGYSAALTLGPGEHDVCAYALNIGPGGNTRLGCRVVTVLDASPLGAVDGVSPATTSGAVTVRGWAFDPSDPSRVLAVHVYVDGRGAASIPAGATRSDVGAAYPSAGSEHGYSTALTLPQGTHSVCVYAINVGAGGNRLLRCSTVRVISPEPRGVLDGVTPTTSHDGRVTVHGWAFDPDDPTRPLTIHVYVDGRGYGSFVSGRPRPDIARVHPGVGETQGFAIPVSLPLGSHQVCVFAINVSAGHHVSLGCRTTRAADQQAYGSFDSVRPTGAGQIAVRGWTIDPDTPRTAGRVHVYVDGVGRGSFPADGERADVGRVHPTAGSAHGFSETITVSSGPRRVCAFATSTGNLVPPRLLRCLSVSVP